MSQNFDIVPISLSHTPHNACNPHLAGKHQQTAMPCHAVHVGPYLFPVLEKDERWHGADVVFSGNVLSLVDVHLQEYDVVHLASHLFGE